MSDEKKPAASAWTEQEKMSLIMQIAALTQPVPWKELDLPAGRTEKACVVMYDKEKAKYKKAKGDSADGEGDEPATPATAAKAKGKKRGVKAAAEGEGGEDEAATPKAKKARATPKKKTPAKKVVKAGADEPEAEATLAAAAAIDEGSEEGEIKGDPEE